MMLLDSVSLSTLMAIYLGAVLLAIGLAITVSMGLERLWTNYKDRRDSEIYNQNWEARSIRQQNYRDTQERVAHEGFFEESSATEIDADGEKITHYVSVPSEKALTYYREMDQLLDDQIFQNTEEL